MTSKPTTVLVRISFAAVLATVGFARSAAPQGRPVGELTLEELANLEVMSVSRRAESVADAPASIFVITPDDIRRSGATTLAEALRLAPNLHVARIDAGQYAISARGFNNLVANKLLVLIDGRTIYTPLFSGVFWDQQDVLLEDVERIEIISGPGATLWGANAVNGVINVITRSAQATQGAAATIGVGGRQQGGAFRYGGALGSTGHFRVYGKATHFENTLRPGASAAVDGRHWLQAGFRADWGDGARSFTLQSDAYRVESVDRGMVGAIPIGGAELSGQNLLAVWVRQFGVGSQIRLQGYFDHTERKERVLFQPDSRLADVEMQHAISRGAHHIVWGAGYRHGWDDVADGFLVGFRPTQRELNWADVYVRDEIRLNEQLTLAPGIRFDRNDYTGWEYQPDVRVAFKPSAEQLLWGAASRAVRAPARFDRDVIRPAGGVFGGPNFVSEVANVLQLGYRARVGTALTWSVAAFHHQWDHLRSATAPPVQFENKIEGPVYGIEGWTSWQALRAWRLTAGFSTFRKDLTLEPESTDPQGPRSPQLSNDPDEQWMLRSYLTLSTRHEFDVMVRQVGKLVIQPVPAYTAVDARYGWRVRSNLELSILGQNLFDRAHPEFNPAPNRSQFERAVYLQARWFR